MAHTRYKFLRMTERFELPKGTAVPEMTQHNGVNVGSGYAFFIDRQSITAGRKRKWFDVGTKPRKCHRLVLMKIKGTCERTLKPILSRHAALHFGVDILEYAS